MKTKSVGKLNVVKVAAVGIFGLLCALLLFIFVLLPLFGPFGSVGVPAGCTNQASHLPTSRQFIVPGVGRGTLLVENADIAIIVVAAAVSTLFTSGSGQPIGNVSSLPNYGTAPDFQGIAA